MLLYIVISSQRFFTKIPKCRHYFRLEIIYHPPQPDRQLAVERQSILINPSERIQLWMYNVRYLFVLDPWIQGPHDWRSTLFLLFEYFCVSWSPFHLVYIAYLRLDQWYSSPFTIFKSLTIDLWGCLVKGKNYNY